MRMYVFLYEQCRHSAKLAIFPFFGSIHSVHTGTERDDCAAFNSREYEALEPSNTPRATERIYGPRARIEVK